MQSFRKNYKSEKNVILGSQKRVSSNTGFSFDLEKQGTIVSKFDPKNTFSQASNQYMKA